MTQAQIHLAKTLCAMRWVALLRHQYEIAKSIELDQAQLERCAK